MSKYRPKRQKLKRLNAEGRYLRTQIESNANNRILAYNNLDEDYSEKYKKQLLKSCSCGSKASVTDMKLQGNYSCKYRFCIKCLRYRSVKQRFFYAPAVDKIYQDHKKDNTNNANLWFLTLTKPTVKYDELPQTLDLINRRWKLLYDVAKKHKLKNFSGIRKIEVTANPIKKLERNKVQSKEHFTYHAHLHILVHSRSNALYLRDAWLKRWPEANIKAQNITKYNGNIAEMLKYLIKMAHGHHAIMSSAYSKAVGWVFNCLQKRRIFFTFGSIKKVGEQEYNAWKQEKDIVDKDIIDELTDEERQAVRPDKVWAEGQVFIYDKVSHNYVADGGLKLVEKSDFNINDPMHFSQVKRKAISRFDSSALANIQEEVIRLKGKKLAKKEKDYKDFKFKKPKDLK